MKKNRMMRLASVLMVLTLLSTSVISGTFAKYITTVSADDSARVAKWGFNTASIGFEDLFAASYTNVTTGSDEMAIIAPGTSGKVSFLFANSLDAGPEVAYKFTVSTEGSAINDNIVANGNIKWALVEGTGDPATDAWGTFAQLLDDIQALDKEDGANGKEYVAGAIPDMVDTTYTVHWKWDFVTEAGSDDINDNGTDNDSWLGNVAADSTDPLVVTLKVTITAEQVD